MRKAKYNKSLHVLISGKQQKNIQKLSNKSGASIGFIIRLLIDCYADMLVLPDPKIKK